MCIITSDFVTIWASTSVRHVTTITNLWFLLGSSSNGISQNVPFRILREISSTPSTQILSSNFTNSESEHRSLLTSPSSYIHFLYWLFIIIYSIVLWYTWIISSVQICIIRIIIEINPSVYSRNLSKKSQAFAKVTKIRRALMKSAQYVTNCKNANKKRLLRIPVHLYTEQFNYSLRDLVQVCYYPYCALDLNERQKWFLVTNLSVDGDLHSNPSTYHEWILNIEHDLCRYTTGSYCRWSNKLTMTVSDTSRPVNSAGIKVSSVNSVIVARRFSRSTSGMSFSVLVATPVFIYLVSWRASTSLVENADEFERGKEGTTWFDLIKKNVSFKHDVSPHQIWSMVPSNGVVSLLTIKSPWPVT